MAQPLNHSTNGYQPRAVRDISHVYSPLPSTSAPGLISSYSRSMLQVKLSPGPSIKIRQIGAKTSTTTLLTISRDRFDYVRQNLCDKFDPFQIGSTTTRVPRPSLPQITEATDLKIVDKQVIGLISSKSRTMSFLETSWVMPSVRMEG